MSEFDYTRIPVGFYETVLHTGHPVRRCWHLQKFERIRECLPLRPGQSLLDIGCFAGSFLSQQSPTQFVRQLGVDILPEQIEYATKNFGKPYREFRKISASSGLAEINESFDCITLIEVIEHLPQSEAQSLLKEICRMTKPGGSFVFSTPNYISLWPFLEFYLNHFGDINYEEQHILKFNYFNLISKLKRIYPPLLEKFDVEFVTTTHFAAPFLAAISLEWAQKISKSFPHNRWHFPFGALLVASLKRRNI